MKGLLAVLGLGCGLLSSQADITVQLLAIPETGPFVQADGSALADGSVARVGYFDEAGLNGLDAAGLRDFATVDALFAEVTRFSSAAGNYQSNTNLSVSAAGGTGRQIYVWVFNGSEPSASTQSGIFTDPSWTVPTDFGTLNMVSQSIDAEDILLGASLSGSFALADMGGSTVPGSFTELVGGVDSGSGIYMTEWFPPFLPLSANWVMQFELGLLYTDLSGTEDGFFLYSQRYNEWVWSSRTAWPAVYEYSSQSWLYLETVYAPTVFIYDYTAGTWRL